MLQAISYEHIKVLFCVLSSVDNVHLIFAIIDVHVNNLVQDPNRAFYLYILK